MTGLNPIRNMSGSHTRTFDGKKFVWLVEDLWLLAKNLPIIEVDPELIINLDRDGWFTAEKPTPRVILSHMQRILNSDLTYPVILHPDGSIMDGAHRVCKAILLGEKAIQVVRFTQEPPPSHFDEQEPAVKSDLKSKLLKVPPGKP